MICGEGTEQVTAMVWLHPDHAHCHSDGVPTTTCAPSSPPLERLAADGGGASQRVERLLVLTEAAVLDAGEITDKGYVNQRAVRERRGEQMVLLTAEPSPARVVARP